MESFANRFEIYLTDQYNIKITIHNSVYETRIY
jgi:hypothetical protein